MKEGQTLHVRVVDSIHLRQVLQMFSFKELVYCIIVSTVLLHVISKPVVDNSDDFRQNKRVTWLV